MDNLPEDTPDPTEDILVEPSATQIPEGVDIPVDTPYGTNEPVQAPATERKELKSGAGKEGSKGNTIRIPAIPFLVILLAMTGGTFILGNSIAPKQQPPEQKPQHPQEQKPRKLTNFVPDQGLYQKGKAVDSKFMLDARLEMGKTQIFVITGNPGAPHLLAALTRKKAATGIPIFILTGTDTPKRETEAAKAAGFTVYRIQTTLERPYSIVIVDSKLVLDASRNQWCWETSEKEVVEGTRKWAAQLMEGAEID